MYLPHPLDASPERIDTVGIEMFALRGVQIRETVFDRPGLFVGPFGYQRIEYVGDRNNPGDDGNVLAVQPGWVSRAIVFLVMAERDDRAHREILRRAALQDVVTDARMALHDRFFFRRERS